MEKKAINGTYEQHFRSKPQNWATIRFQINNTGTANPNNGIMTESSGATLPENAATMVIIAKMKVAIIKQI